MISLHSKKEEIPDANQISLLFVNAGDRNRTGTMSPPQDFKSCVSTYSTTRANRVQR